MEELELNVYLAGEIHSGWRREVEKMADEHDLPIDFTAPVTDHEASDEAGAANLWPEENPFWKDRMAAQVNAIRTRNLIERADVIVVRFAGKYREWNAAFDAGLAVAQDVPLITLHDEELDHALKEVDAAAFAVARTTEQVVNVLRYVTTHE